MSRSMFLTLVFALTTLAHADSPKLDLHGDPLPPGAIARLGSTRWHVGTGASFLSFQPDGTILSISDNFLGQVWDPCTGKERRHFDLRAALPGAPAQMYELFYAFPAGGYAAYSGDGSRLALVTPDRRIHLLDATSGKFLKMLGTADPHYFRLGLSREGGTLYLSDFDGSITLWDTRSNGAPRTILLPRGPRAGFIASLSYLSPDGKTLLQLGYRTKDNFADRTYLAMIWDLARGTELRRITLAEGEDAHNPQPVVSPDRRLVAIPLKDAIRLVSLDDGKEAGRIAKPAGTKASNFLFAPDGKSLIGRDSPATTIMVWQLPDGKVLRRFDLPPAPEKVGGAYMLSHALAPDGKFLAWTDDATIRVIDLGTGKLRDVPTGHTGPLRAALFTADGKEIITHGTDNLALRWDPATGRESSRRDLKKLSYTLEPTADGKRLLTWPGSGRIGVHVLDAQSLKETHVIRPEAPLARFSWTASPGSRSLAFTTMKGNSVQLLDIATGKKLLELPLPTPPPPPAQPAGRPLDAAPGDNSGRRSWNRSFFSPDGRLFAVASDGFITVWEVSSGRRVGQAPRPADSLRHVAVAPDGQTIAVQTVAGTTVWELPSGSRRLTLDSHEIIQLVNAPAETSLSYGGGHDFPRTVAYSPDARLLVVAGEDRTIRVRDAWDGRELTRLDGFRGVVVSAAFSPDGRRLVSAHTDTTALVWDLEPARAKLRQQVTTASADDLDALVSVLAEPDSAKAFVAMRKLAADPAAVAAVRRYVKRAEPVGDGVIDKLIVNLNDARFATREKARQELEKLGEQAGPALRRAAESGASAEVQRTARRLLERLEQLKLTPEQLRAVRAVEVLERIGTPEAAAVLKDLATGADEVAPTPQARAALKRLW